MAMTVIWTGMVVVSILCGLATGNGPAVAAAAMEGAAAAVELCLSMAGGALPVDGGDGGDAPLRPVGWAVPGCSGRCCGGLYPEFARDREVMDTISANVSANLLGLGNAATPLGHPGRPADEPPHSRTGLRRFVYAGGVQYGVHPAHSHHGGLGAPGRGVRRPLTILPAVWLASAISVCTGIGAVKLFGRVWRG